MLGEILYNALIAMIVALPIALIMGFYERRRTPTPSIDPTKSQLRPVDQSPVVPSQPDVPDLTQLVNEIPTDARPVWQFRVNGKTSSLVSARDLRERIARGTLVPSVQVWTEGASRWKPASGYAILTGDSSTGQSTSDMVGETLQSQAAKNAYAARIWQYRVNGKVSSDFLSTDEIRSRIADGHFRPTVDVWTEGIKNWRPAADYVVFADIQHTRSDQ